jgi:tRNA-specific 2-thiouridylase
MKAKIDPKSQKKGRVLVGMSGGLDSSVTAALLIEQGYDVIGVYMNLWADPTRFDLDEKKNFPQNKCCSIESLMFARSICQQLGIPFYSVNLEDSFKKNVVDFFLEGFKEGETPNPCVRCNKTIKFGLFFDKMKELGCDYLATGHYASLETDEDGTVHLMRGVDVAKDQTYFLYNLEQERLKQILFPIGAYEKDEVREIAKKYNLKKLEKKKESQGVCFYPEKSYMPFLRRFMEKEKDYQAGEIIDSQGKNLGKHEGLPFYTVGQRRGIGVGGGPALYVNKVDKLKNAVIVGSKEELTCNSVLIREVNFLSGVPEPDEVLEITVRSHGRLTQATCKLEPSNDETSKRYRVDFIEPQSSIMAGQSLVMYRGRELVGGGIMSWK